MVSSQKMKPSHSTLLCSTFVSLLLPDFLPALSTQGRDRWLGLELLTLSLSLIHCSILSRLTILPPSLAFGPQPSFRVAEFSFLHVHHCILMSFSAIVLKFSLALCPSQRTARLDKLNYVSFFPAILHQLNLLFYFWINIIFFSIYSACIPSSLTWLKPLIGIPASRSYL